LCNLPLDLVPDQNSTRTHRYFADLTNPLVSSKEEKEPIPVATPSAAACLLGLRVRISPGTWISFSRECRVLSDRGLCVGPISRPIVVCALTVIAKTRKGGHDPELGRSATGKGPGKNELKTMH
jgi:hypothetical protein